MILIVNICKERLHYFEFVKPVEDILTESKVEFFTRHYMMIKNKDLERAENVIITGTSLKDNDFLENLEKFSWINDFQKPLLGICGGSHIIGLLQGNKLTKRFEVGMKKIKIESDFLGIKKGEKLEVYNLHKWSALPDIFHRDNYYATLFHPEVRNRNIIETFAEIK